MTDLYEVTVNNVVVAHMALPYKDVMEFCKYKATTLRTEHQVVVEYRQAPYSEEHGNFYIVDKVTGVQNVHSVRCRLRRNHRPLSSSSMA